MQERAVLCRNQALVWERRTGEALGLVTKPHWCGPRRGHLEGAAGTDFTKASLKIRP